MRPYQVWPRSEKNCTRESVNRDCGVQTDRQTISFQYTPLSTSLRGGIMIVVAFMIMRAARELELWLTTWLLFCHLVNKGKAGYRDRIKRTSWPKSDFNKRLHPRATDERCSNHQLSSFRCSNLPGKATGTVRVQTHIRTRARRKSKWTTGGYSALRRCGWTRSGKGTQFHCLKFRLGSAGKPTVCSHCYDVLNEDVIKIEIKYF